VGEPKAYLKWTRELPQNREIDERICDFGEVVAPADEGSNQRQAARCMDCGVPFCVNGCPLGNLIPEWNHLVYRERWQEAYLRLRQTNPLPEITGRVCPAPCEPSCVLAINDGAVTIEALEKTIADRAFEAGFAVPRPSLRRSGRSVAVVGSGPAGLAAASVLNQAGHRAVVYERADRVGGLLRYGIPDFKLDKRVLDARLAILEAEGVVFEVGVAVGTAPTWAELRRQHDALVIATGARVARDLRVPGRELRGVHQAMSYLEQQNRVVAGEAPSTARISAEGKRVVILGGGDTGSDCLGTAIRQGATSVVQVEILPQPPASRPAGNPWPQWPRTLRSSSSQREGGQRLWGLETIELTGHGGQLAQVHAVEVRVSASPGGALTFQRLPGSATALDADLLLLALGFLGPETKYLQEQLGLELDHRGNVAVDDHQRTSVEGVWCAGDAARGASLVVWALVDGRDAAEHVHAWLRRGVGA